MSTIIALSPLLHQLQGRQSVEDRSQKAAGLAKISFLSSGLVNQLESSDCDYPMPCRLLIIVLIKVQIMQKSDYLSFIQA